MPKNNQDSKKKGKEDDDKKANGAPRLDGTDLGEDKVMDGSSIDQDELLRMYNSQVQSPSQSQSQSQTQTQIQTQTQTQNQGGASPHGTESLGGSCISKNPHRTDVAHGRLCAFSINEEKT